MSDLFEPQVSVYNYNANAANTYAAARASTTSQQVTKSEYEKYMKTSSTNDNLSLSMEDFLSLLVAQFQNQDIENPADTSDMLNQLMQMSTIQAMTTMTDASVMTYAASMVGKEVTIGDVSGGSYHKIVGLVTGTAMVDGEQSVFVNGKAYPLTSIMAIGKIPEDTASDTTDKTEGTDQTEGTEKQ